MTDLDQVKPCPFCRSRDIGISSDRAFCRGCDAIGPRASTRAGAIQRWNNHRAADIPTSAGLVSDADPLSLADAMAHAVAGMAWWNGMVPADRQFWMGRAGNSGVVADAYTSWLAHEVTRP